MTSRIGKCGDKTEQLYWGRLGKLVPHYQTFWQLYVVPLRAPGEIWFRQDIDPGIETIAIASYSTFSALGRAYERVYAKHENFRHIEDIYAAIQRAVELGVKTVNSFASLERDLLRSGSSVSPSELEEFKETRLSKYRNLLHDAILPMPKNGGRRKIPKLEKIDAYRLWTDVMYRYNDEDFVFAVDQIRGDFRATCSHLEAAWKAMCERYDFVKSKLESQFFIVAGEIGFKGSLVGPPAPSGHFYIGSDEEKGSVGNRFQILETPSIKRRKK